MPRISRAGLPKARLNEISGHYLLLVSRLKKEAVIKEFFENFYTKEEKIMLAKRLMIYMLLRKGYSSEDIKLTLHVSYETVRTYKSQLERQSKTFLYILDNLLKHEANVVFFKKLDKKLQPLEDMLNAKTNMRARARLLSGDYK